MPRFDDLHDPYDWDDYGWEPDYDPYDDYEEPEDYDPDEDEEPEPLPEPDEPHEIVLPLRESLNVSHHRGKFCCKRCKNRCRRVDNSKPKRKDHHG